MPQPPRAWILGFFVIAVTAAPAPQAASAGVVDQQVNPIGAATKAFLDRLQDYVKFRHGVDKTVPALAETSDPAKISDRQRALGEALIKSRPDAKPGDFFIAQYQPVLVGIIREDFAKRSATDRKAIVQELPKGLTIGVNMTYPTTIALATFPPNLLEKLPALPPELEYRIVGRHLILRDIAGNVIVDVMRDVIPTLS